MRKRLRKKRDREKERKKRKETLEAADQKVKATPREQQKMIMFDDEDTGKEAKSKKLIGEFEECVQKMQVNVQEILDNAREIGIRGNEMSIILRNLRNEFVKGEKKE